MTRPLRLGVNIDHVATVRNARGGTHPDPLRAAEVALAAGADGITAHLREDRRHISDADIDALSELLRAQGGNYRDLEAAGVFLAVVRLEVRYRRPARYDDLVRLRTELVADGPVKIEHRYEIRRGDERLGGRRTTLACLDRDGQARLVPPLAPVAPPGGR